MTANKASHVALSKSRFVAGVQCLKRLYFQVYHSELATAPDESTLAILQQGQDVGELARKAFPGGVLVEAGPQGLPQAINRTEELVADPGVQAIFEGIFKQDNIVIRSDILARKPEGGWRLIEVKSSTHLKDHYACDVGIQHYVIQASGLEVSPCLMHLNREYIYDGDTYAFDKLFAIHSLETEIDGLRERLPDLIRQQREVLSRPVPPAIEPGRHCLEPVRCEFFDYCNKPLPEDHVSLLPGISSTKVDRLIEQGIHSIHNIPANFSLSDRQRRACGCVRTQTTYIGKGVKEALSQLTYPLFFMDFETFSPAIPRYAGMRPYDHIPFQWSIHARREPGGELEHYEFLAADAQDPRLPFLLSLLETLDRKGHVIVYNCGFESQRLGELARRFTEYADPLAQIQARLWDLLDVFRKHVYHPRFMGSFSLKSVLPALIPDMTYDGMEVSQGDQAGLAWDRMIRDQASEAEKLKLRQALLAYCKQDTLAMVRLLDFLAAASSGGGS